jgi:hypothetical protein
MNPIRSLSRRRSLRLQEQSLTTSARGLAQQTFCRTGVLERPRYYPGQLMTPEELILEQDYHRDKMRRHNRLLHGWGVVCGAIVCRVLLPSTNGKVYKLQSGGLPCPDEDDPSCYEPWKVSVSPGYILGPYGDEIMIDCTVVVDVRNACTTGQSGDPCPPAPDPWCSDVVVDRTPGEVYLAVRYKEISTRPVPVQPYGCGCDGDACEYSRIRDGFEICTLDECPASHEDEPERVLECEVRPCPPCPDEPWVVLARVVVNENGVQTIDYECRRTIYSLAGFWCYPALHEHDDYLDRPRESEKLEPAEYRPEPYPEPRRVPVPERRPEPRSEPRSEPGPEPVPERIRELIARNTNMREDELSARSEVAGVVERPATDLNDVRNTSLLGRKLDEAGMTIGRVAGMARDEFLRFAIQGIERARQRQIQAQAARVWERAHSVHDAIMSVDTSYEPT